MIISTFSTQVHALSRCIFLPTWLVICCCSSLHKGRGELQYSGDSRPPELWFYAGQVKECEQTLYALDCMFINKKVWSFHIFWFNTTDIPWKHPAYLHSPPIYQYSGISQSNILQGRRSNNWFGFGSGIPLNLAYKMQFALLWLLLMQLRLPVSEKRCRSDLGMQPHHSSCFWHVANFTFYFGWAEHYPTCLHCH